MANPALITARRRAAAVLLTFAFPFLTQAAVPWTATVSASGEVRLAVGRTELARITPGLFTDGWKAGSFRPAATGPDTALRGVLASDAGATLDTHLALTETADGLDLVYTLTAATPFAAVDSLHIAIALPAAQLAGRGYEADGRAGAVPAVFTNTMLVAAPLTRLRLHTREGGAFTLTRAAPAFTLLQDSRQWGPMVDVRLSALAGNRRALAVGEVLHVAFRLSVDAGLRVVIDRPVLIEAGATWVPFDDEPGVVPGSALDFSGWLDAPAGKYGRVLAAPDGTFHFAARPGKARRFYGANLCFGAQYLPRADAERLAADLARMGYNAVRLHHYEGALVGPGDSTRPLAAKLEQFDGLFAALKSRGLYVTTDLFVSRPVSAAEVWPGASGPIGMDDFKLAVLINTNAFANWKAFARNLLTHRNPHTGLTYAEDPALAWLSMINEGNAGNFLGRLDGRLRAEWTAAWNVWLAARYPSLAALRQAWGRDPGGDPRAGTVPLWTNVYDPAAPAADAALFCAGIHAGAFARMRRFLRDELGCQALLTDLNAWANPLRLQEVRRAFDYVDDHFYVDHPQFIDKNWQLPSRCPNTSPIPEGAPSGRSGAFLRLLDKPFTISEFNYSGPGRFRGVGGILTGCRGALQGWGALWRFAYSHNPANLFQPAPAGYFDVASDPLNALSERAALCLYLRGDLRPAPHRIAIVATPQELSDPALPNHGSAPPWADLAWITGVGTWVAPAAQRVPADLQLSIAPARRAVATTAGPLLPLDPFDAATGPALLEAMRARGWLAGNRSDLASRFLRSETGELTLDGPADRLTLDTACTAGGYAPRGGAITTAVCTVFIDRTDATVWVSSLDGQPIATSRRLLLCHLTDLQNTRARFAEGARQTLLAWGTLPHLVLDGQATVRLRLANPSRATLHALSASGRRLEVVPTRVEGGVLAATLAVRSPGGSARMAYELTVE